MTQVELAWRAERACRNAWPALRVAWLEDWLVHLGDGLTRRANSANPLRPDYRASEAMVAACEALYHRQGQPAIFRLPTIVDPALDRQLAARDYTSEGESLVLYGGIAGVAAAPDPEIRISPRPSAEWFAAMALLQGHSREEARTYRRIIGRLLVPVGFAMLTVAGEAAALAYGALSDRLMCFESVVADRRHRRRGFGRRIVSSLAAWARERDAAGVCLEVEATNSPALALYDGLGFRTELYRYHYRREQFDRRWSSSGASADRRPV